MVLADRVPLYPNQNTPGVKKVAAENQKKAMLKKMQNQNGRPRPPAVDAIKFLIMMTRPQNITVACLLYRQATVIFCGLVI